MAPLLRIGPVPVPALVDVHAEYPGPRSAAARVSAVSVPAGAASDGLVAAISGDPSLLAIARLGREKRSRRFALPPEVGAGCAPPDLARYAGVRLDPHRHGFPTAESLATIDELGLPVFVHAGEDAPPELIGRRLLPSLRVPVVLAHLGCYPAGAPHLAQAIELARRHENVYLDTAAAWLAEFLAAAARAVPQKIFFGSGSPFTHPDVAWAHVGAAVTDDEHLLAIAHRNAERVLGW